MRELIAPSSRIYTVSINPCGKIPAGEISAIQKGNIMKYDLVVETCKALETLVLHKIGQKKAEPRYKDDFEVKGYCLWASINPGVYGKWVEVQLSKDGMFNVVADEYQPWGTGGDDSWLIASYDSDNLIRAMKHAIQATQTPFSLDGLMEDEETGRYQKHVFKPEIALAA